MAFLALVGRKTGEGRDVLGFMVFHFKNSVKVLYFNHQVRSRANHEEDFYLY